MIRDIFIYLSIYVGLFAVTFFALSYWSGRGEKHPKFSKKKAPFVSIIVPAWNEEAGIAQTIKSIQEIDYPEDKLEVIVVDDGSIDKSFEVASKFKGKIVKVFRMEKNSGKFAAVNFGIKNLGGKLWLQLMPIVYTLILMH